MTSGSSESGIEPLRPGVRRDAHRIRRVGVGASAPFEALIGRILDVARAGLPAMFDRDRRSYVHSLHRVEGAPARPAGHSVRYGAMVALGARWLEDAEQRELFGGENAREFAQRLLDRSEKTHDLGDLAVVAWAASATGCRETGPALERLGEGALGVESIATVELAWVLSALVAGRADVHPERVVQPVRDRLLSAFPARVGVFPHVTGPGGGALRRHVACFADQVYPIQALARYHRAFGDRAALSAATRCAERICGAQGEGGQWWWHYDARNGRVIEGYPVYSVHQDAMGPMALFDLQEAGGPDMTDAVRRGLRWMEVAAEVGHSLIDEEALVIWRKVGRAEPGKLLRTLRAGASRLHAGLRLHALNGMFPATRIDYECRPYHLGWVLDTWLARP